MVDEIPAIADGRGADGVNGPVDGPLSDQVLDRLRLSAAMAMAVPRLAVKIRVEGRTCLEVVPAPAGRGDRPVMAPHVFHSAVAEAFAKRRSGDRIAMRGVAAGCEPAVDWGVPVGARILPGGVVRSPRDDRWHHAAAVLGDEAVVAAALRAPGVATPLAADRDQLLGVTILHAVTGRGDKLASVDVVDAVHRAMAAVGAEDLERRMTGVVPATAAAARPTG